jgi:hypothetical protein
VDSHLKRIPCLTTFTTRCFPCSDLQILCREADGALDAKVLRLRALNELLADLLKRLDIAGCEGDTDLVDFLKERSKLKFQ